MQIEILQQPLRFQLHGVASPVEGHCCGEVGVRLMDEMWNAVRDVGLQTTGINHWVYLDDGSLFVGVELVGDADTGEPLRLMDFELQRYLRHVHVGLYQDLPRKWQALKQLLATRGETITSPSLEIYGHACEDPSQAETTILIALAPKVGA